MQHPPDDLSITDDLTLVASARAGDRLAFGVLYLRHHAAAWRIACVASRFSPDAELAVIEGFTRVFSALPEDPEVLAAGGVTFRPYLLACVRQSALDRAEAAGRAEAASDPAARRRTARGPSTPSAPPASLAGLTVDGEVRLSGLEHHVARGALAALPERSRSALWLTDVEAMTPGEVAGVLGGSAEALGVMAATARDELHLVQQAALDRQEVRAGCRFAAERLADFEAGTLDPSEGLQVRSHLAGCPTCRMRRKELGNAAAALAAAVPAAPLLGGETQHHWLASISDVRPAERLLPPVLAAGGSVPRESLARRTATGLGTVAGAAATVPDALRRAGRAAARPWQGDSIDLTTRSRHAGSDPTAPPGWTDSPGRSGSPVPSLPPGWTVPSGRTAGHRRDGRIRRGAGAGVLPAVAGVVPAVTAGLPGMARRATRAARPALTPLGLAVAWVLVMMALPRLLSPSTAPGPQGLALPAVQAYMPDYAPGAGRAGTGAAAGGPVPGPAPAATVPPGPSTAGAAGSSGSAEAAGTSSGSAEAAGTAGRPSIGLAAASGPGRSNGSRSRAGRSPAPSATVAVPLVNVAAAVSPESPISLIPTVVTPSLDAPIRPQLIHPNPDATPAPAAPVASKPTPRPDIPKADRPGRDQSRAEKAKAAREKARAEQAERQKARAEQAERQRARAEKARAERDRAGRIRADRAEVRAERREPVRRPEPTDRNGQKPLRRIVSA